MDFLKKKYVLLLYGGHNGNIPVYLSEIQNNSAACMLTNCNELVSCELNALFTALDSDSAQQVFSAEEIQRIRDRGTSLIESIASATNEFEEAATIMNNQQLCIDAEFAKFRKAKKKSTRESIEVYIKGNGKTKVEALETAHHTAIDKLTQLQELCNVTFKQYVDTVTLPLKEYNMYSDYLERFSAE